ncbi:hypothetical protein ACLB1O_01325 [Escherichia coli]
MKIANCPRSRDSENAGQLFNSSDGEQDGHLRGFTAELAPLHLSPF